MRLRPHFVQVLVAFSGFFQAAFASSLRQRADPSEESSGDAAKAFAHKTSARLRLLSDATRQVLAAPGVEQDPLFSRTLHKVSSQLQESSTLLERWGNDYARDADVHEMAATLADKDAAYEVQELRRQLRAAIEADQEAQLEQPKRLADLSQKVEKMRSQLKQLAAKNQAHRKPRGTALISNVWPRPPKSAKKEAELGLFMHGTKQLVNATDQDQENEEHFAKLESRLSSLEQQLKDAQASVETSHAATVEAHEETKAATN
jgi:chromosome segregation ATPase